MGNNYVVGRVWNEVKKKFQGVIGYEFNDAPGFYEFYEVGTSDHFRKRPNEHHDEITPISEAIFNQFFS